MDTEEIRRKAGEFGEAGRQVAEEDPHSSDIIQASFLASNASENAAEVCERLETQTDELVVASTKLSMAVVAQESGVEALVRIEGLLERLVEQRVPYGAHPDDLGRSPAQIAAGLILDEQKRAAPDPLKETKSLTPDGADPLKPEVSDAVLERIAEQSLGKAADPLKTPTDPAFTGGRADGLGRTPAQIAIDDQAMARGLEEASGRIPPEPLSADPDGGSAPRSA